MDLLRTTSEFTRYFIRQKLEDILDKAIDCQKHWLMVVKQGRIMMDPQHIIEGEFKEDKALQEWLDI